MTDVVAETKRLVDRLRRELRAELGREPTEDEIDIAFDAELEWAQIMEDRE